MPTKSAVKNTRWALMEQRMSYIEEKMELRLKLLEEKIDGIKTNEILHMQQAIDGMRQDLVKRQEQCETKIDSMQKIIYKAVGAAGAVLTIINIVLKVL